MRRLLSFVATVAGLACVTPTAQAASDGLVTIVEGRARLLRGTSFFTVKEGMALVASDIVETQEQAHIQVEFADGSSCGLGPQTLAYFSALPAAANRPGDVFLRSGWLKVSNPPMAGTLRGSTLAIQLQPKGGVFVLRRQEQLDAFFVESGELTPAGADKSGPRAGVRKAGEFVEVRADNTLNVVGRPNAQFLSSLPRPFIDTLPARAPKFAGQKVDPVLERQVNFDEADAWVKAYPAERKTLLRRFSVRLKDTDFRQRVEGNLSRYPEWDRLLHPEKYLPTTSTP